VFSTESVAKKYYVTLHVLCYITLCIQCTTLNIHFVAILYLLSYGDTMA